jgi:glycosyltransferase involved in cell wall biosynthesis
MAHFAHHFGPDPTTVGGMATVIRTLTEHNVGADIVDFHSTWKPRSSSTTPRLVASSARALIRMPSNHVIHIHLSEGGSFLREGSLVALSRHLGLVTVATIHGAEFVSFAARHPQLVTKVLKLADLVTCLDQETLDFVRLNAPATRSELMPNPIYVENDFSRADATEELIVFGGEIGLRKGADVLHRAWQLVARRRPQARCLMVGPITDFEDFSAERLEARSPVGPLEMKEILRRARAIALPARAERMPMILIEAMSMGRPFVSTPVGAIPELAAAGGMLVAIDDHIGLANCLTGLLADPHLAGVMGERGRQFCIETRSIEIVDARLRELYSAAGCR